MQLLQVFSFEIIFITVIGQAPGDETTQTTGPTSEAPGGETAQTAGPTSQSIDQTTQSPSYTCAQNNFNIQLSLYSSAHSAQESSSHCSLSQCSTSNNSRLQSMTPCFDYRTISNISYCALASLCSILEPCNNVAGGCASDTSVCVVNSCCAPSRVCLPVALITLCSSTTTQVSVANNMVTLTSDHVSTTAITPTSSV